MQVVYMKYLKSNEKGITLIELLLAIILLTIVLTTFMAFFTNAFQYNSVTSDKFKGVNYVREKQIQLKESTAFKTFIYNISDGLATTNDLSKSNTVYTGLNLIEDITETSRPVKLSSGSIENQPYYLMKLNWSPYKIFVYVKISKDYPSESNSSKPFLYRLYIETFDKNNQLLSETYTYYEYK